MEEENKKLKKELADMFKALDEKETLIQSNKNEVMMRFSWFETINGMSIDQKNRGVEEKHWKS